MAKMAYKRNANGEMVRISGDAPKDVQELTQRRRASANPLNWPADPNVEYGIAGLGGYNKFRRYPGKVFPNTAAGWRESAAESDRAAKKAAKGAEAEAIQESL